MDEAKTRYLAIKAWWSSFGATLENGLRHLELWLAFWHFRYRSWGGFMELISTHHSPIPLFSLCFLYNGIYWLYIFSLQNKFLTTDELAEMPSCNLTKTVHNKWL